MGTDALPADHAERVYAGCLGKVIGVYLGRPFEMWSHEEITARFGTVDRYVAGELGVPLVVTDDDISGTFTFARAMADHGNDPGLTSAQIGQTWLDYVIEDRTILWWGGLGNSTEHTAFLRLRNGVSAPRSGSTELNGRVVAEQIGAQIFIDGWAMMAPGDPARAADLAARAARVSHDGEAVNSARVLAAMESLAFVEPDIDTLLDTGLSFVPADCVVAREVADLRAWHRELPDWHDARRRLEAGYGNQIWGGNCHTIPNFGLIVLALLWGGGDFDRSMEIVNTAGWDTDCNSGNLGCLLGIRNGLAAFDGPRDWRGPVADRMYLSTADGGRAITDVATESLRLTNTGRALVGEPPMVPASGARFHFRLPGSVQGFGVDSGDATVANVVRSTGDGVGDGNGAPARDTARALAVSVRGDSARVTSPTFVPPGARDMPGYRLLASPTLYPGQVVESVVAAPAENTCDVRVSVAVDRYDGSDALVPVDGPAQTLRPGGGLTLRWTVPDCGGQPVAAVGIAVALGPAVGPDVGGGSAAPAPQVVLVDSLGWSGTPTLVLDRPAEGGTMWHRAWVDDLDDFSDRWPEPWRLVSNEGRGMATTGTEQWRDYRVSADLTPHLATSTGVAVRARGLRHFYAVLLGADSVARLVKAAGSAGEDRTLAEAPVPWELGRTRQVTVDAAGDRIRAWVDGVAVADVRDSEDPLTGGAAGLVVADGRVGCGAVTVGPSRP